MKNKLGPVLKLEDVAVAYKVRGGEIEAVQNVSFEINRGETHGIVGESGCGKSTVAWAILNFLGANGYVKRGSIKFLGQELVGVTGEELRRLRGDQIAMVYQDPMQALNPSDVGSAHSPSADGKNKGGKTVYRDAGAGLYARCSQCDETLPASDLWRAAATRCDCHGFVEQSCIANHG
jgi:ABC-type glutathione transport system ATPase component